VHSLSDETGDAEAGKRSTEKKQEQHERQKTATDALSNIVVRRVLEPPTPLCRVVCAEKDPFIEVPNEGIDQPVPVMPGTPSD
jgi:hypothetical protein